MKETMKRVRSEKTEGVSQSVIYLNINMFLPNKYLLNKKILIKKT